MRSLRIKILAKIGAWVKEKQFRRSKRRLENSIVALSKFNHFLKQSGISRQECRYFWREFGSSEKNREDILRKMCQRMGLRDFDKLTRTKAEKEKGEE